MKTLKLKPNSNKPNNKTLPAFTIIEVVLVLAIAGLIFLMVFIALPALQRNQRDTQRKNDMSRVKTALDNYKSNNKNTLPEFASYKLASNDSFAISYLKSDQGEFKDPDGSGYSIYNLNIGGQTSGWKPSIFNHIIHIGTGFKCNGETILLAGGTSNYVVLYRLEGGGVYCIDG